MGGREAVSRSPSAPADRTPPEPQTTKKRKAEKEPETNKKAKVMENKAIWISNLPLDTTKTELEEEFSRYGMIDKGANGEPRINLYKDDEGKFNGTAMIVYFKKEAIVNAVKLADDYPLRLGETKHGNIRVEPASMDYKKEKDGDKVASKLTRSDRQNVTGKSSTESSTSGPTTRKRLPKPSWPRRISGRRTSSSRACSTWT